MEKVEFTYTYASDHGKASNRTCSISYSTYLGHADKFIVTALKLS